MTLFQIFATIALVSGVLAFFFKPYPAQQTWQPIPLESYLDFPYKPMEDSSIAHHRMYHASVQAWMKAFDGMLGSNPPRLFVDKEGKLRASAVMYLQGIPTDEQVTEYYELLSADMGQKFELDVRVIPFRASYRDHDDYVETLMRKMTYDFWADWSFRNSPGVFNDDERSRFERLTN